MATIILIEVTPTFREYLLINRHVVLRYLRWLKPFAVLVVFCFLMAPWLPWEGNPGVLHSYRNAFGVLWVPAAVFGLLPLITFYSAKRRWQMAAEVREPKTYEFSESGISVKGMTFQHATSWDNIVRAETVGPLVVLYTSQHLVHLIPVEALADAPRAEEFREMLRRRVPDCRRL